VNHQHIQLTDLGSELDQSKKDFDKVFSHTGELEVFKSAELKKLTCSHCQQQFTTIYKLTSQKGSCQSNPAKTLLPKTLDLSSKTWFLATIIPRETGCRRRLFWRRITRNRKRGFLKLHADFNKHPTTKLDQRLNLLIYLNKEWKRRIRRPF
jgi:hypothetical protein